MRGEMNLREAFSKLSTLPEEATLFVERIGGCFRPESRVFVLELTEDGGVEPTVDQALESAIFYAENDAYPDSYFFAP